MYSDAYHFINAWRNLGKQQLEISSFGYLEHGLYKLYYIQRWTKRLSWVSSASDLRLHACKILKSRMAVDALHHTIRCKVLECRYVLTKEEIPVELRIVQIVHIPILAAAGGQRPLVP